jgi:hypothetical protein
MFLPSTPDLDSEDPDPALLAFVKCHITSPARWEVLRILASNNGAWLNGEELARATHRQLRDLTRELDQLVADDVVQLLPGGTPEQVSYRLPADEPTSIVLHRLIESATHSREMRAIIAAHLQHLRQQAQALSSSTAAA